MNLTQHDPAPGAIGLPLPMAITVYGHSRLFYWWPIWVMGFVLAAITYWGGERVAFGDAVVIMHPSKNLGVLFTIVTVMVVLMTNVAVRGLASLTVIISILAASFLFAYMNWWDDIFRAIDSLAMFMNLGFYVFFSTSMLLLWLISLFVFDRLDYWEVRPGQLIHHQVFGGGATSHDTDGMSVFKLQDDLFRHWVLGLGSGDLHLATSGALRSEFVVANVLFVARKLAIVQRLVAMKPDETATQVVTVGDPT